MTVGESGAIAVPTVYTCGVGYDRAVGAALTTPIVTTVELEPPGPVAVMVSVFGPPAVVGVPEIVQSLFNVRPAGNGCEAEQEVIGPPELVGSMVAGFPTVSVTVLGL